jgi:hypothetical protein
MARSLLAASLACAGIYVLAGLGWALLAGACLTFALVPGGTDSLLVSASRRALVLARRASAAARSAPRRAVAAGGMGGGLALVPAGLGLWIGAGAAAVAAGGLLIGLSLLTGQGA